MMSATSTSEQTEIVEAPVVRTNPDKLEFKKYRYFFGRIQIEIGEGYKTMTEDFNPTWKDDQSSLAVVDCDLPMGMVIEESEKHQGKFEIMEVMEGSNAEKAGVKVGDILRANTAQKRDTLAAAESNIAFNSTAGASMAGM